MKDTKFVICIDNSDYPASLEKRKIYQVLPDSDAEKNKYVRVIDESGEDYIYPSSCFVDANLSKKVLSAVTRAA
jgi:hypothetical protein